MQILGIVKSSFIDYPQKICAVIFTGGCNFRCGYCHNPELVKCIGKQIEEKEIFSFLDKRKKYLDAVCISGGEPTLQKNLTEFVKNIKGKGFLVKLDTNGTNPEVLSMLIEQELIDYVAMDIKAPLNRYAEIVNEKVDTDIIKESIEVILNAHIGYEFRTTIHKEILDIGDLIDIAQLIEGAEQYSLQNVKKDHSLLVNDSSYTPFTRSELDDIKEQLQMYVKKLNIRY